MDNFKLIVFTSINLVKNESALITLLFDEGLEHLHLKKDISIDNLEFLIRSIPENYRYRIVIHINSRESLITWIELVNKYNIKGLHLSASMRKYYNELRNKVRIISTSCHSFAELKQTKLDYEFEYYFISPLFNSISKRNYFSNYSISELNVASSQHIIDNRVIALGGIDARNIWRVKSLGFGGAAVLGAIWF